MPPTARGRPRVPTNRPGGERGRGARRAPARRPGSGGGRQVANVTRYMEPFVARGLVLRDPSAVGGARTDEQGRFRIEGLLPREYDLATIHPPTLELARVPDVPAGAANVELRFTGAVDRTALAGVLVDGAGRAVSGVFLAAGVATRVRRWPGVEGSIGEDTVFGPETVSDAEGRFRLEDVPASVDRISVDGDPVLPAVLELDPGADRGALALVVEARCHLQVEVGGRYGDADRFHVLDGEGEWSPVWLFQTRALSSRGEGELVGGRSPVYAVSDRARSVVLRRGLEELGRVAIEPVPGEVTLVRAE